MVEIRYADFTDSDEATISEIARTHGVSLRTLRFYEQKELLTPRRVGNRRYYGATEAIRLAVILKAKKMGFTLAEIARILDRGQPEGGDSGDVALDQRQIEGQLAVLVGRRQELETAIQELHVVLETMESA